MTTATFRSFTTTYVNQPTINYIESDPEALTIGTIPSSISAASYCGINGTYFNPATGNLTGLALAGGAPIKSGGDNAIYRRGTLYRLVPNSYSVKQAQVPTDITTPVSNIAWALSGLSLFLGTDLTSPAYYQKIDTEEHASSVNSTIAPGYAEPPAVLRTAFGYNSTKNKMYLVTTSATTPYAVRMAMKYDLGCTHGIILDSGSSTGMRYKDSAGTSHLIGNTGNSVYMMMTCSPTSWV